jgi:hypothetical protein
MKTVINEFAIEFVQYLREKDVISISQKQINLLTDGKEIKSFSEHLVDFNNRNNNLIKNQDVVKFVSESDSNNVC